MNLEIVVIECKEIKDKRDISKEYRTQVEGAEASQI